MTKAKKHKYYILMGLAMLILTGCRQEPMIKISEENQASIEAKLNGSQEESVDGVESSEQESSGTEESVESMETTESTEPEDSLLVENPSDGWSEATEGTTYDFWSYAPYVMNQIKEFTNGSDVYTTYMNYGVEDLTVSQVQQRSSETVNTSVYQIADNQVRELVNSNTLNPYNNVMEETVADSNVAQARVLLQAPLTVGTSWQNGDGSTSEITTLYATIELEAGPVTNVVEVTTESGGQFIRDYYAQNQGFVARFTSQEVDGPGEFWQLTSDTRDVMIIHPMTVFAPSTSGETLTTQSESAFVWQTNGSLANSFQQILLDLGIINESITVNSVELDANNIATIDFSPGVVAVMNEHPASEEAVIQSIVETLGAFFETNQVRLTVNGNGLLPSSGEYPENGIYQLPSLD